MKPGCASPVAELLEFFEEMERDFMEKKHKIWVWANDHLCFGVLKLLAKCSNKQNAVGYLEILKIYEEKMYFLKVIFQKDKAPVQKAKTIGKFAKENEWTVLEWPAHIPEMSFHENLWVNLKQRLRKQKIL